MDYVRTDVISNKIADEEISDAFSDFQGSILWPKRSLLYRLSFLASLPLFGIFLLGFSSPFWMKKHQVDKYRGYYNIREKVDVSIGLWRVCEGTSFSDITDCTVIPDITNYIVVCQAMLCLCLIFTVFSLIFGLYENCATRYDYDEGTEVRTKRPEMNAVVAGLFGMTGVCMYGTLIIDAVSSGDGAVHWAFPVTALSVTGLIICGVLMAITNPVHLVTKNFPGQVMSLSRQNSLKAREPTIQDRLVASGDSVVQVGGAQTPGTTYGVTASNFEIKEVQFLQRSESRLSSHISSPDLTTTASQDLGVSNGNKSTYVVEAHDIHARTHDLSLKQESKQQSKAAQRRSLHFDDENRESSVSDIINNPPCVILPPGVNSHNETKDVKPFVPRRRDKPASTVNSSGPPQNQTLRSNRDEAADLMVLEDLLVKAPPKEEHRLDILTATEDASLPKRKINPFIEDTVVAPPLALNDLQRSTVSSGSWENQPWPDPPTENEMLGQKAIPGLVKSSSSSDGSASNTSEPHLKSVPESMQCQPQSQTIHSRKHSQGDDTNISYKTLKSMDSHIKFSKGNQNKQIRKLANKKSSSFHKTSVPVRNEYDNPLFKSQPPDGELAETQGQNLSSQICESTLFVHPLPEQSFPQNYYTAIGTMQSKSTSKKTHSIRESNCPTSEVLGDIKDNSRHMSNGIACQSSPASYNRFGKKIADDTSKKHSVLKENSKRSNTSHQHQNGDVNSRPRQGKRDQQQIERGRFDSELVQTQQPSSPHGRKDDSSPHLVSKLPKPGLRRPETAESEIGPINGQEVYKGNARTKIPEPHNPQGRDASRQHSKTQASL